MNLLLYHTCCSHGLFITEYFKSCRAQSWSEMQMFEHLRGTHRSCIYFNLLLVLTINRKLIYKEENKSYQLSVIVTVVFKLYTLLPL